MVQHFFSNFGRHCYSKRYCRGEALWVRAFAPQAADLIRENSCTVLGDDHYKRMPRVTVRLTS